MAIERIATYRPVWDSGGQRIRGGDEDGLTMAVAATRLLLDGADPAGVRHVSFVTRTPDLIEGPTEAVIRAALRLPAGVPVELRLGGGPAVLDLLAAARPGTLVLTADPDPPAAAAAAWVGDTGAALTVTGRTDTALTVRVHPAGEAPLVYDDTRLLRERGWKPAVTAVARDTRPTLVTGLPPRAAAAFGSRTDAVPALGASAPLFGLVALAGTPDDVTLVAVDGGRAVAAAVTGAAAIDVRREERPAVAAPAGGSVAATRIPASAAATERAFAPRVGLLGARCECGALEIPPRHLCLTCGREAAWRWEPLPFHAVIYTTATIHTPVPGRRTPYSLAVVDVGDVGVRLLAPVTDVPAGTAAIGDRGRLVLRRLADRETGPDYGYAFQPDVPGQPERRSGGEARAA